MKRLNLLVIGLLCLSVTLAGCKSIQPASAVVDRHSVGENKVEKSEGAEKPGAVVKPIKGGMYVVQPGDTLYNISLDAGLYYKDVQQWNGLDNPNKIVVGQTLRLTSPDGAAVTKPLTTATPMTAQAQNRPVVEERALPPSSQNLQVQQPTQGGSGKLLTEPKVNKQPYSADLFSRYNRDKKVQKPEDAAPVVPAPTAAVSETPNWIWPSQGKVIGNFGENGAKGVDLAGTLGDPVKAVGDGKVVYVGTGLRGYGQMVIVKHDNNYLTAYAHNRKLLVTEGQAVTQGQKIAEMGNSDSDRVKLHFEVRKSGKPVDPLGYLPKP